MTNIMKVLSACSVLLVATGCACHGNFSGKTRHSKMQASGKQSSMHAKSNGSANNQASMPARSTNSSSSSASRRQMTYRTSEGANSPYSRNGAGPAMSPGAATTAGPGNAPPTANEGECWASVYYPPQTKNVTERICLKEPSERFEVTPAEYEWVEERVCVKEASRQFVVVPARYETVTENVVLDTGHTDWVRADQDHCRATGGEAPVSDVFCPVNYPRVEKNVTVERLVQPASMREVEVPAEYQTVRIHKLVKPATSRRIEIPGEYQTVEKTVEVSPGRWEWARVKCDAAATMQPINPKVRKTGHVPNP